MATIHYDDSADLSLIQGKKVAIFGYGSQGHAHALNLKDSGVEVRVALADGSRSRAKAEADGVTVTSGSEAAAWADVIMILAPDTKQRAIYEESIVGNLQSGNMLMFAHGFNIRYNTIAPPSDVDVTLIAPKAPGHRVREVFLEGGGTPALIAVEQDATGNAHALALSYAKGLGVTRAGVIETTFTEETETDLFGEQAVLCGGVSELIKAGFQTLVDHGDYTGGPRVVNDDTREAMSGILKDIQDGTYAKNWIDEDKAGRGQFMARRKAEQELQIEHVGADLRAMMPFLDAVTLKESV